MAGYRLTVCLPGQARDRLDEAVGEALAPFFLDRDGDISQDLRIWDGWAIRGGAEGAGYRILPGHEADPRIVHDHPLWNGTREDSRPGWCAGGPRGLLEVAGPSARTGELAGTAWDRWQEILREHPAPRPWEDFLPDRSAMEWPEFQVACLAAHAEYLAQTPAGPFRKWAAGLPADPVPGGFDSFLRDLEDPFSVFRGSTRKGFVQRGAGWAAARGNLLTLDGWWCEQGYDPLHGACDDPAACPHTPSATGEPGSAAAYLAGLPDDTLLVSVRCHV